MPRLVAFLRAINVGGHTVTMDELRGIFEALGFQRVETFIASGNVIFTPRSGRPDVLERKIEDRLHRTLGYEVKTFVRTEAEIAALSCYKPFEESLLRTASGVCVGFLAEPPAAAAAKAVTGLRTTNDDLHVHGREIFWLCKTKMSESTISMSRLEKALKAPATFRNVNTISRLMAKYEFV